ncbi:type III polyketide synthase [Rhizobiaceae bacterium]|nr:type III polyketide synthase [Rhizobiaceae bacterium]
MDIHLNGIATVVPPHVLPQDLVLTNARRILGSRYAQFERMSGSFKASGVETRYSFAPIEWFEEPRNWPERNAVYVEGGTALFIEVAHKALASAGLKAADVDAIVTVSSTGIATPTLEARAARELGFRNNVMRVPVFGLGCAGGVSGLAIARDLAAARPGTNVLLIALEACTLSFRSDRLQKADIIATVLFGDGASAAIVSSERTGDGPTVTVGRGEQEMWPDTLNIMGWDVDEAGLGVIFDRSIPAFASEHFAGAARKAVSRMGVDLASFDRLVCHPGGAKVVEALEGAMELEAGSLDAERTILRDFGNMSAPTVLFVLQRVLEKDAKGSMLACALGPGFTASFVPLEVS